MKHIFIDFEMHPIAKEFKKERVICQNEIIEFGAVILDDNYMEVDSFKKYVKPQYVHEIYTRISVLTGITQRMLVGKKIFKDVFEEFIDWSFIYGEEITVYAWSKSDLEQLTKEMKLKSININERVQILINNWVDFQKDYCDLIKSDRILSLEKALNLTGQYFMGNMHDALCDARNTAELFTITRDKEVFFEMIKPINEAIRESTQTVSSFKLSDLINFDEIMCAMG